MTNDLSQKILDKIDHEHIKPVPRWHFMLKNYFFWGAFILSVLVGSLASAVAIGFIRFADWDLYDKVNGNPFVFLLRTLPYFWLIFFAFFTIIAYYNLKHTKNSYKRKYFILPAVSLVLSLLGGYAIYSVGLNQAIEKRVSIVPGYRQMTDHMRMMWQNPQFGLLSGTIVSANYGKEQFDLIDLKNNGWLVEYGRSRIDRHVKIENEAKVKIVGHIIELGRFEASDIRPFVGQCMHHLRGEPCPMDGCSFDRVLRKR